MLNHPKDFNTTLWRLGAWQSLANVEANLAQGAPDFPLAMLYRGLSLIQLGDFEQGVALIESVSANLGKGELTSSLLSGVAYNLGRARSYLDHSMKKTDANSAWLELSADLALGELALPSLVEKRNSAIKTLPVEFKSPNFQWSKRFPEWSQRYVFNDVLGFWHRPAAQSIDYSDGDEIEGHLLNVLHSSADVSLFSRDLIHHQTDWPTKYHLSADRANLLRPLAKKLSTSTVLELGCGCGAITRYLGELGAEVVALEGSLRRAEIAATRTRDLKNVTIVAERLQDFPLQGAFDVVTLIGVLEYSQVFVDVEDPIQAVLERAKSYLKPDGILLVAIENQLGLKYFAGAPEDHGVGVMAGINDLYTDKTAITFGHQELQQRIQQAGFSRVETFLPFPDYKLPMLVVHPSGHDQYYPDWNLGTLLASSVACDRQKIPSPTFSLERAWPVIVRNGLTADLANSHLLLASLNEERFTDEKTLASYFSPSRAEEHSQQLDFVLQDEGDIVVHRQSLANTIATLNLKDTTKEPYVTGVIYADLVHDILQRPDWTLESLLDWCIPWLETLREYLVEPNDEAIACFGLNYSEWLPSHFIDAIPRNLILQTDGKYSFIDLEWIQPQPIPLSLVVYRGLMVTLCSITSIAEPRVKDYAHLEKLLTSLMLGLGLPLSELDYAHFMPVIDRLARYAQGLPEAQESVSKPYQFFPLTVRNHSPLAQKCTGITLYWSDSQQGFDENTAIKDIWWLNGERQSIVLTLPNINESFTAIRLDLADCPAHIVLSCLLFQNYDGEVLWSWDFNLDVLSNIGEMKIIPVDKDQMILMSTGNDPQFIINLPESLYSNISGASVVIKAQGFNLK